MASCWMWTVMVACSVLKLAVSSFTALPVVSKCNWTHKIGDAPFVVPKVTLLYWWGALGHNTINVSSVLFYFISCKCESNNIHAPATKQRYVKLFPMKYQRQSIHITHVRNYSDIWASQRHMQFFIPIPLLMNRRCSTWRYSWLIETKPK